MRKRTIVATGLITITAAATLAGCGAGEHDSAATMTDQARAQCVTSAGRLRDSMLKEPALKMLGAFDITKAEGKSLWIVNAARVPFLQGISDGAAAAAKAAGMQVKVVYGDGSTNSAQAAIQQAIAQGADGIALVVVDPTTVQHAVDQAEAAGIVVSDVLNRSTGDPMPHGVSGQMVLNLPAEMDAMAGWILADSKCSANTLMYAPSALPITAAAAKLLGQRYTQLCPSCRFELKDLDYGNFASTLTAEVQTDVRRIPGLDHVIAIVGSSVPNVDAGLQGNAGIRVVAHDGLADNLQSMRENRTHEAADFAFAPTGSIGWQLVDQQARLMVEQSGAAEVIIPSRLVDKGNLGANESDVWPGYAHFEQAYTDEWHGQP
ncbi:substrate-binding domain-containing protein [Amycolatopsis rhabdoformis]|uniref:Substrate-binding domain-containing protein n=1 Tax=Amycolatopsis rhabdoformis TaxID=1448059 RepID=A0ABZ1IMX3_9PSEU|nr:substrate-binding domain-containing protein [Amycolatopsis rhabdoformis]WSE34765.1 substrate-binding domain-containing protein [Amycolatopsis rhabdoformis]